MSQLSISNVINVSVSTPPTGVAAYQVNNLVIFTKDVPVNGAITQADPGVYESITDVLADWGADSEAYDQAVAIFSQSPNILDGNGRLVIFPMESGDTLAEVIVALFGAQFFGGALVAGYDPSNQEYEDASAAAASTSRSPASRPSSDGSGADSSMCSRMARLSTTTSAPSISTGVRPDGFRAVKLAGRSQ